MTRALKWENDTVLEETEILGRFKGLRRGTLLVWIERGWVIPERGPDGYRFREIDVARVGLIFEFSNDLELDEDTMAVILPLLDQIHGLRRQLWRLADAVSAQPEDVRQRIVRTITSMPA